MRRPSIQVTLISLLLVLTALFGIFGYVSMSGIQTLNSSSQALGDNWLPSVKTASNVEASTNAYRLAIAKYLLSRNPAEAKGQEENITRQESAVFGAIEAYMPLVSSPKEAELIDSIKRDFTAYRDISNKVLTLSRSGNGLQATNEFFDLLTPIGLKVIKNVSELVKINVDGSKVAQADADHAYSSVLTGSIITICVVGAALLSAIAFISFGVAKPISRITASMKKLTEGDVESPIPFPGRGDELGAMASAVEIFRQAAITNKRLEQEAEANRKQADADRIADQQKAEADAADRLRIATSGLAAGLKRLASGDLAFQLEEAFAPDFEALRHDFNQSIRQLGETLTTISQSIGTLDDGTREISSGARDLSKRTEQQAASLEETAAALDQITANVSNSSKRTEEARTIANHANQSAVKSAEVVSHAEEAMRRIEYSSQQISNIIGVIDEIAFQTNLLALNAGVEAARAGEAGKGFAVVAQEVRELAQRSAKAAKEIKELIQNSTVEVESGVKLVRQTGTALGSICDFIADINRHMDAISTSAREQSTGLAEVNTAVNSMDQTTQQNAAMVEQSTAASASLAQEAERLRMLVSRFALGDATGANQANLLRQTAKVMAAPVTPATPIRQAAPAANAQPRVARPARAATALATNVAVQGDWEEF